jgi:hypothetical protein
VEPTVTDFGGLRATSFWDDIEKNFERASVAICGRFGGHLHRFPMPASKHSGWHLFPRGSKIPQLGVFASELSGVAKTLWRGRCLVVGK